MKEMTGDCVKMTFKPENGWNKTKSWFRGLIGKSDLKILDTHTRGHLHGHTHHRHMDLFISDVFSADSQTSQAFENDTPFDHPLSDAEKHFPIRKFIRAAKRIQRVNKKLASFEQGFLSKDGIKDREWYLHLGVAPGKNLGMFHSSYVN